MATFHNIFIVTTGLILCCCTHVTIAATGTATYYTAPYVRRIQCCCTHVTIAATGTATYYTAPYVPSACNGYTDQGVMIAAASDAIWENGGACGKMYSIKCLGPTNAGVAQPCTGNSVTVKIVDYCPTGCQGTIDLSQEAFSTIANTDAGKINISYDQV